MLQLICQFFLLHNNIHWSLGKIYVVYIIQRNYKSDHKYILLPFIANWAFVLYSTVKLNDFLLSRSARSHQLKLLFSAILLIFFIPVQVNSVLPSFTARSSCHHCRYSVTLLFLCEVFLWFFVCKIVRRNFDRNCLKSLKWTLKNLINQEGICFMSSNSPFCKKCFRQSNKFCQRN